MSNVPNKTPAQRERMRLNDQRGIVLRTGSMVHNPRLFARLRVVERAVPLMHREFEERQGRAHTKRRRRRVTAYAR